MRIHSIEIDDKHFIKRSEEVQRERNRAITDIQNQSEFILLSGKEGPYHVFLTIKQQQLLLFVTDKDNQEQSITLSLSPLRKVIKDYYLICESYFDAIKDANSSKVEAIDMGRRGVHNEGAECLQSLLKEDVQMDFETARKLFTLVSVLHLR